MRRSDVPQAGWLELNPPFFLPLRSKSLRFRLEKPELPALPPASSLIIFNKRALFIL